MSRKTDNQYRQIVGRDIQKTLQMPRWTIQATRKSVQKTAKQTVLDTKTNGLVSQKKLGEEAH